MAPDDRDDNPDEPRAKDLLTTPREELAERMDPATLAQLASWFDQPNLAVVEEEAAIAEADESEERELEALRKRREAACAAADPAFVARVERRRDVTLRQRPDFDLAPIIDERILNRAVRAQLDRQSDADSIAEAREYDQPGDVYEIVQKHNAPQAILRDLFRPVAEWDKRYESPFDELPEMDPAREVRELMRTNHTAIEWVSPGMVAGKAVIAEGKERYRLAWPEAVEKRKKAES